MSILFNQSISLPATASSFDKGKEYRINQEFSIPAGEQIVFKFVIGVNTILKFSSTEVDQGGVKYSVFTSAQTTENSAFNTVVPIYRKNLMVGSPTIPSQNQVFTGGTATFSGVSNSVIRIRTSSGNASRSSTVSDSMQQRGFPPTSVYVQLLSLEGINTTTTGVLSLEWEEV